MEPQLDASVIVDAVERHGSIAAAARVLGKPRETIRNWYRKAVGDGVETRSVGFEAPEIPSAQLTVEELLERRKVEFKRRDSAEKARRLVPVNVLIDGPIGVANLGDPHVDDPGCDIEDLERHVKVINSNKALFGANLGDLQNNWVGRLARLWAEQSMSAREGWALTEWLVRSVDWLYLVGGNHDCHDTETEALTRRGWLHVDDITLDDEVFTLNTSTEQGEWQRISSIIRRPYCGNMIEISTTALNALVTPNHRVLSKNAFTDKYEFISASEVAEVTTRRRVPSSVNTNESSCDLTDVEIYFAGLVLTDGCMMQGKYPRIFVYQRESNISLIAQAARDAGFTFNTRRRERQITEICGTTLVKAHEAECLIELVAESVRDFRKRIMDRKDRMPSWAYRLDDRQFRIFLDALIEGDRTTRCDTDSVCFYNRKPLIDELQVLCAMHGFTSHIYTYRENQYRLHITERNHTTFQGSGACQVVQYDGEVWCLTVPNSNFMVRRKGKVHFSGNCWSGSGDPLSWILRDQVGVTDAWGVRIGLKFPNGKEVRINARHDFAGHSQFNPAHGPMKAIQMGWRDHILTCGHKHTSFYAGPLKDPSTGLLSHAIRCAGFKVWDNYGKELGLPDQNCSASATTIIDPQYADDDTRLVTVIWDIEEAADYLKFKRNAWEHGRRAA